MPVIENPIIVLIVAFGPLFLGLKILSSRWDFERPKYERMNQFQMANPNASFDEWKKWESKQGIKGYFRKLGDSKEGDC